MLTILIFVVILGLLVFVHELGHFLVAKWHGIQSEEFGFGFPPRLAGLYKGRDGKWHFLVGDKEVRFFKTAQRVAGSLTQAPSELTTPTPLSGIEPAGTIYSLNWIPLGGFVKIKGEDGSGKEDPESFANRPAWRRVSVLAAGVVMNFILAWVLFSLVFMLGLPQPISPEERPQYANQEVKIQILEVQKNTPAESIGLKAGDELLSINGENITSLTQVHDLIVQNRGTEITVAVDRFGKPVTVQGTPRVDFPEKEGALGIAFSETAVVRYSFGAALKEGLSATYRVTGAILGAFGKMIASLFGAEKVPLDVSGPVGIVYLTKQMSDLGLAYLLQFAALLSINLGIINILPIPALDGGRILFILIEKLKGTPVSQRVEGMIHQIGFILLLLLMLLVTLKDFAQFQILQKIGQIF